MRWFFASLVVAALAHGSASTATAADQTNTTLVKQTMGAFADGLVRSDMAAFHAAAGPKFRAAHSPQSVKAEFAELAALKLDLGVLESLQPVFTREHRQGDELELAGFYPSTPLRAYFGFRYELSGADWQLLGIGVRVVPVVTASTMRHNAGWTITLDVLDPAREVQYALPGEAFRSTGHFAQRDPNTGDAIPRQSISVVELPRSLQVKVITRSGTVGPVTLSFDADAALVRQAIDTLEQTRGGWALLRTFDDSELLYFTHLVSYRCGIEKVRYGLGSDQLDREYKLPACDPKDPGSVPDDFEVVTLDRRYDFVAVQLDYRDGKRSQLVRIPHPDPVVVKPGVGFLVEQRSARPSIHELLRDIIRNLPAGAELEQVSVLNGALLVRARANDASVLLKSLSRVATLQDPKLEGDSPSAAGAAVGSFQVRATARPAPAASAGSLAPAFIAGADFDSAAGELRANLTKRLAESAGTQSCTSIMTVPLRTTLEEPYERVTLKVRLRCNDTDSLLRVIGDLEKGSPSAFIDDVAIRIITIDLGGGQRQGYIDAGFDLYGYLQGGKQP